MIRSVPEPEAVLQSYNRKFKNIKNAVPGGMPLSGHN